MKVYTDTNPAEPRQTADNQLTLPHGLIGFEEYRRAEILYSPDQLPFLWLKATNPKNDSSVHFIVMEPADFIPGYEPELFDEDAASLKITDSAEVMILNIVAVKSQDPLKVTINLVGPIIVNRRTRVGRQLVVSNYQAYSSHHQLVDFSVPTDRAIA